MNPSKRKLALLALIVGIVAAIIPIAYPVLSNSLEVASQRGLSAAEQVPQISYYGEVTYQVHAGKSGRIYPASSNSTVLVLIHTDTYVTFTCATTVNVQVDFCIELAVSRTTSTKAAIGVQAKIDGIAMNPNVAGSSYLAGYVAQPEVGTVGNYAKLESWDFTWEKTVGPGTHIIRFYWAVSTTAYSTRVWGDFYSISVWASRTNP